MVIEIGPVFERLLREVAPEFVVFCGVVYILGKIFGGK